MIDIYIKKSGDDIKEVTVSGHGGRLAGKDIVCSAVSAITQTALSGLLYYGNSNIFWKIQKGTLFIKVKEGTDKENRMIFNIILSTMILGLKRIAKEYPDKITIKVEEN